MGTGNDLGTLRFPLLRAHYARYSLVCPFYNGIKYELRRIRNIVISNSRRIRPECFYDFRHVKRDTGFLRYDFLFSKPLRRADYCVADGIRYHLPRMDYARLLHHYMSASGKTLNCGRRLAAVKASQLWEL